jgi:hypothetical protein
VVLQVLGQRKLLSTELAGESTTWIVGSQVPFEAILVGVTFVAVRESAREFFALGIGLFFLKHYSYQG